jgi:hypothetical protein
MQILPFSDAIHAAYVYRDWLHDDDCAVQPQHVGAYRIIVQQLATNNLYM